MELSWNGRARWGKLPWLDELPYRRWSCDLGGFRDSRGSGSTYRSTGGEVGQNGCRESSLGYPSSRFDSVCVDSMKKIVFFCIEISFWTEKNAFFSTLLDKAVPENGP